MGADRLCDGSGAVGSGGNAATRPAGTGSRGGRGRKGVNSGAGVDGEMEEVEVVDGWVASQDGAPLASTAAVVGVELELNRASASDRDFRMVKVG